MRTSLRGNSELKGMLYIPSFYLCVSYILLRLHSRFVENPMILSFQQILEDFEQVTVPVTLVCAGNRRKEQNVVRKSKGFAWGAAGVSTALFTGPLVASILRAARPITNKAKYVCMEGADKLVLPALNS